MDLFEIHDLTVGGGINVIKNDFFGFITDEKKREVLFDTYAEVGKILTGIETITYYSCLFSIGSILEGMLDDLFERNQQRNWIIFHDDLDIQNDVITERLKNPTYDSGMTLGLKITAVRLMALHNKSPIPRHSILQMLIINEYRDLIHPRRRLNSPYKPNRYVASFLFTTLSKLAGNLWQS